MKTREDLLAEGYLCRADIKKLFRVSRSAAEKIFQAAHDKDEQDLGRARMYYFGKKVRFKSAIWATGLDYNLLQKQIKGGATPAK